ncbi:MAG: hypothetical protein LBT68_03655, partial [Spirochaetales bacterium]|nr:hypothetical protein [Spirochaetales bacterium]
MDEQFSRFVDFGITGTKKSRGKMAGGIYAALHNTSGAVSRTVPHSAGSFGQAIGEILSNQTMKEL